MRVHDRRRGLILGPLGLNFGSGMTGGCLCVACRSRDVLHRDFVTLAELDSEEENCCGALLRNTFTSPPASRRSHSLTAWALPLMRVQPIHFRVRWSHLEPHSLSIQTPSYDFAGVTRDFASCDSRLRFLYAGLPCPRFRPKKGRY